MAQKDFKLPQLRAYLRFAAKKPQWNVFYDAKFYPYAKDQHVFAVVGDTEIIICRPSDDKTNAIEVLSTIRDLDIAGTSTGADAPKLLNSCAWAVLDGMPLLCVAGYSGQIKVFNTLNSALEKTFLGHGDEINDLRTHPIYPHIIASGSKDNSIRIWSLLPEHSKNPCLLILGHGQAHKEGVLTCAFHDTGRYLVSGGLDHLVCLWTLPDLSIEATRIWPGTQVVHFPHFITQAIHNNYVDCVSFYGDLILSKAAEENNIVLWTITGFSSKEPPPGQDTAPVTETFRDTRSGFLRMLQKDTFSNRLSDQDGEVPPFQRLLSFSLENPDRDPFYMRFSLLRPSPNYPHLHPMIAMMNVKTKLLVWDFTRLRIGHDGRFEEESERLRPKKPKSGGRKYLLAHNRGHNDSTNGVMSPSLSRDDSGRERSDSLMTDTNPSSSLPSEGPSTTSTSITGYGPVPMPPMSRKYDISDPFKKLDPHHVVRVPKFPAQIVGRQATWSPDGRWLVVVGESDGDAIMILYER